MSRRRKYDKNALEYVCTKCKETKNRDDFYPSSLVHSRYVCIKCCNKINKVMKEKQKERKNERVEGLFDDFMNYFPTEEEMAKHRQEYLAKRQRMIKVKKYDGGITIRLPKEMTPVINKYMENHGGYISVAEFIRETIRLRLFGEKTL